MKKRLLALLPSSHGLGQQALLLLLRSSSPAAEAEVAAGVVLAAVSSLGLLEPFLESSVLGPVAAESVSVASHKRM